jgi:hypothetical protein
MITRLSQVVSLVFDAFESWLLTQTLTLRLPVCKSEDSVGRLPQDDNDRSNALNDRTTTSDFITPPFKGFLNIDGNLFRLYSSLNYEEIMTIPRNNR